MAASTVTKRMLTIYKEGRFAYNYLKSLRHTAVKMNAEFHSNENLVAFSSVQHLKWRTSAKEKVFQLDFPSYWTFRDVPDKFKEIDIKCCTKDIYEDLANRFPSSLEISQDEVIQYLMTYYNQNNKNAGNILIKMHNLEEDTPILAENTTFGPSLLAQPYSIWKLVCTVQRQVLQSNTN